MQNRNELTKHNRQSLFLEGFYSLGRSNLELLLDVGLTLSRVELSSVVLLVFSLGSLVNLSGRSSGVLSDFSVDLSEEILNGFSLRSSKGGTPLGELLVELFSALFLEVFHVSVDVFTEDSSLVVFRDVFLGFTFFSRFSVSGESRFRVRNVDTTVASSLENTEDSVTSGSSDETGIQNSLEGLSVLDIIFNVEVFSVNLSLTSVNSVQTDLLEESSSQEETSGVGSSVGSETSGETELSEFEGVSSAEDLVALDGGVDDLSDDSLVGSSGDESVLGGVVFILILDDQSLSGVVVSESLFLEK